MAPPAFSIRASRPDDADALSAFLGESFESAYGHISPPEDTARHIATYYAPAVLREQLMDPRILTWIAHDDADEWAGCVQLALDEAPPEPLSQAPAAELRRFYLRPAWFGSGVAPALMHSLIEAALAEGARAVWLSAWQHAARAVRFYEKQGFTIVGVAPSFAVGDTLHDDYIMARLLTRAES
jgi:GNAT superfamily N-acetyltransferase